MGPKDSRLPFAEAPIVLNSEASGILYTPPNSLSPPPPYPIRHPPCHPLLIPTFSTLTSSPFPPHIPIRPLPPPLFLILSFLFPFSSLLYFLRLTLPYASICAAIGQQSSLFCVGLNPHIFLDRDMRHIDSSSVAPLFYLLKSVLSPFIAAHWLHRLLSGRFFFTLSSAPGFISFTPATQWD